MEGDVAGRPVVLTNASAAVGGGAYSSPSRTPAGGVGSPGRGRNPLLFSNSHDPEVLVAENSRLRMLVDEKDTLLAAAQAEARRLYDEGEELRDALLTTRTGHLPKVDVAQIRAELHELKARNYETTREREAGDAVNTSLSAEVRRLREALVGKETILAARSRSLDRYAAQIQTLREDMCKLEEVVHRERDARQLAELTLTQHTETVRVGKHSEVALEQAVSEKDASLKELIATQSNLQAENARLAAALRDLRAMGAEGISKATMDNFDEARVVAEESHRAEVRELRQKLLHAQKYEAHARAAVGIAHKLQRRLLLVEEEAARSSLEAAYLETGHDIPRVADVPSRAVAELLAAHARAYTALRGEVKKSRLRLREQFLVEVQPIVDEAYLAGHQAGLAKGQQGGGGGGRSTPRTTSGKGERDRRRSSTGGGNGGGTTPPVNDDATTTGTADHTMTTDAATTQESRGGDRERDRDRDFQTAGRSPDRGLPALSQDEQWRVFENVLRTSPATQIAAALSRFGLKVIAATPVASPREGSRRSTQVREGSGASPP